MIEEIAQLVEKFNKVLEEHAAFPCRAKFKKARAELDSFKSGVSGRTLPDQTIEEARGLLNELRALLEECLKCTNETCAGNLKAVSVLPRLRKVSKRLKTIRDGVTHEAGAVDREGGKPYEPYCSPTEIKNYEWTSSFIERENIYGMDAQVNEVVDSLVRTTSFATVGIVGMQGSGKTALAQKVFTDERVLDKFALRLWVCVSPHRCEPKEVVMRMLDSVGVDLDEVDGVIKRCGKEEVGVLLFLLYMVLLDNSYLIVFDDVRSNKHDAWYRNLPLLPPTDREWTDRLAYGLPKGDLGGGSAVIVTSRSEDVARAMVGSGGLVHRMKPLQDDLLEEGWTVFEKAFYEELKRDQEWEKAEMDKGWGDMKRRFVEKCNGLPLALKVAGRELACRKKNDEGDNPPPSQ